MGVHDRGLQADVAVGDVRDVAAKDLRAADSDGEKGRVMQTRGGACCSMKGGREKTEGTIKTSDETVLSSPVCFL